MTPDTTTSPLDDERLTLAGLFFESHAGLSAVLDRKMRRECQLTPQWFEVLIRLARTPGGALRMSELAAQTSFTPSGLTRVVDRLEEEGLVRRTVCDTDRRGSFAQITEPGRDRIEAAIPVHLEHLDEHFTGLLSDREQDQLERVLRKLRDHVLPGARPTDEGRR